MEQRRLDWSTADVRDGTLTVTLDAKPPKDWIARFKTTVRLLNYGSWETVELKRAKSA